MKTESNKKSIFHNISDKRESEISLLMLQSKTAKRSKPTGCNSVQFKDGNKIIIQSQPRNMLLILNEVQHFKTKKNIT